MYVMSKKEFFATRDKAYQDAIKTLRLFGGFNGRAIANYLAGEINNARNLGELEDAKIEFRNYLHSKTGKLVKYSEVE